MVRVENTRTAQPMRMRHTAAFHTSQDDLLRQLVPMVAAGLESGGPVLLAARPATMEALRATVGHPAELITLVGPESQDSGSGQTLAARRARQLRELTGGGTAAVVISEHWNRYDGVDGRFWTELDAAMNVALSDLPVRLTCFFPEMPLHLDILEGARRNHPWLLNRGIPQANPQHRHPREVLAELPAPAPVVLGPPELRMVFGAWQLNAVREAVERALLTAGYGRDRAEDVVLAVNEVATNAVEHGTGGRGGAEALLYLWSAVDGFVVEVHDRGPLRDPLPGLRAPHPSEPRGRGVWIARQLCDSLHIWSSPTGTHVRMRAAP